MGIRDFSMGFMVGFGTGLVAREALPMLRELGTPIFRVASKSGIKAFEYTRESMARIGETMEDIMAEVRSEMRQKRARARKPRAARKPPRRMAEVVPLRKRTATP